MNVFFIPFNKGGGTVIDWEDMPLALCFNWYKHSKGYATANIPLGCGKYTGVLLHRMILDFPEETDHIDGVKLNNLKSNLRKVTDRENSQNLKRHRDGNLPGGYYDKRTGKWRASAHINGKQRHIKYCDTEKEMNEIYLKAIEVYNDGYE